jgi:hypothetical protein
MDDFKRVDDYYLNTRWSYHLAVDGYLDVVPNEMQCHPKLLTERVEKSNDE